MEAVGRSVGVGWQGFVSYWWVRQNERGRSDIHPRGNGTANYLDIKGRNHSQSECSLLCHRSCKSLRRMLQRNTFLCGKREPNRSHHLSLRHHQRNQRPTKQGSRWRSMRFCGETAHEKPPLLQIVRPDQRNGWVRRRKTVFPLKITRFHQAIHQVCTVKIPAYLYCKMLFENPNLLRDVEEGCKIIRRREHCAASFIVDGPDLWR